MAEAPVSGVSAKLPIERVSENEHALCPRQNPMQRRTHMKRSEINKAIRELEAMCKKYNCYLPPFCDFTPEQWQTKGHEYDEVRECMLGWDITDYGLGKFDELGFSLITIPRSMPKSFCI